MIVTTIISTMVVLMIIYMMVATIVLNYIYMLMVRIPLWYILHSYNPYRRRRIVPDIVIMPYYNIVPFYYNRLYRSVMESFYFNPVWPGKETVAMCIIVIHSNNNGRVRYKNIIISAWHIIPVYERVAHVLIRHKAPVIRRNAISIIYAKVDINT